FRYLGRRHTQADVRTELLRAVPFVQTNQRARRRTERPSVREGCFFAGRFRPPADRERTRRTPVEGTIHAPRRGYLETREDQMLSPDIIERAAGNDVPIAPQPRASLVLFLDRF